MEKQEWAGTTYGNGWMHKWLIRILRYIDIRILYAFVVIFVIPVCMVVNPGRKIIYHYYRSIWKYSSVKSFIQTYINFCLFGQVVIDKFAMYAGKKFNVEIDGYDDFLKLAAQPDGFIQLSAHIGNYEIAGYTLVAESKAFNALVFAGEKESVMESRNKMFSTTNIHMIPIRKDMSHLFLINEALERGETVSMPADRINGSPRYIEQIFLGAKASFPQGPFSVATMRGLDVLAVNVMKESMTKYHIYVTPLQYDRTASRKDQIEQLSRAYVDELENILRRYPHQWYNYFEFWNGL